MKSLKGEKTLGAVQQFGSFGVEVEFHRFPPKCGRTLALYRSFGVNARE